MAERLIVLTRYPEAGRVKTRLIPALGDRGAAELHRKMAERTMSEAGRLCRVRPVSVEVRYSGGGLRRVRRWLGPGFSYRAQGAGSLGARMHRAFRAAFDEGMARAVLIGTDCPGNTAGTMGSALDALGRCDVVLGPAADGGYYLIGLRQDAPGLFRGIPWGTDRVLDSTMNAARRLGLSVEMTARLRDVDGPEDLEEWEAHAG